MKRPKHIKPKTWRIHLQVQEMNKEIIKKRKKSSLYIPNWLDEVLLKQGEYKNK